MDTAMSILLHKGRQSNHLSLSLKKSSVSERRLAPYGRFCSMELVILHIRGHVKVNLQAYQKMLL